MELTFVRHTLGGRALLEGESKEPIARPAPLFYGKRKVGVVRETIGRVERPFYVAELGELPRGGKLEVRGVRK